MARPHITLKLATSLDGKIALSNGTSEWITSEAAREAGRRLRGTHDAICVGANTAHLDNPQLTTRIEGEPDPIRVIFDSGARLSPQSNLAQTAKDVPVYLFCREDAVDHGQTLADMGVKVLPVPHSDAGLNVEIALDILKRLGVHSLLIEGGGRLAASFVALGVVDKIEWFRAPIILGGDGRDAIGDLGIKVMDGAYGFERIRLEECGVDVYETYQQRNA